VLGRNGFWDTGQSQIKRHRAMLKYKLDELARRCIGHGLKLIGRRGEGEGEVL
jgi:hypothetical protein